MLKNRKKSLAIFLEPHIGMASAELEKLFELPKDKKHGDLAFPCFALAKQQKKNPAAIAQALATLLSNQLPSDFSDVQSVGGYLNFSFNKKRHVQDVLSAVFSEQAQYGHDLRHGKGETVVVDYSSPNVAKPMSIGHLRSTVIGQSLVNLHKAMGFKTIGVNYLGDWGVQFGKLAWAHLHKDELLEIAQRLQPQVLSKGFQPDLWEKLVRDVRTLSDDDFDYLYALYVVFHALAEVDDTLNDKGRATFVALENREDAELEVLWKQFVQVSLQAYNRVYHLLGVHFDHISGESHHEKELPHVVKSLKGLGLLKESEGAQVVDLEPYEMPPCLIQKTDGATLYATRDIAAALHRHDHYGAHRLLYVVGAEQTLHFRQLFKVLELMGLPWSRNCVHVAFGLYRFKEGKMSTRRGNVIFLEDVLDRAVEMVEAIIKEKNPDLVNPKEVAKIVGTGAVVFNDLMNDRVKNIDFDWDRILDFNGDTGPYVQYTHVRCASILKKWSRPEPKSFDAGQLKESHEWDLITTLGRFDEAVRMAFESLKPNVVAHYLLDLSKAFNSFYYEHRILEGEESLQQARVALVLATKRVLLNGLALLGISAPEAM